MRLTLDVGCGSSPKGDVNCDLFIGRTPHIRELNASIINPKIIPNFVCCDAHFLPFRCKAFDEVISRHVLEHLKYPSQALTEMVRVATDEVIFIVPHRYLRTSWLRYVQNPKHLHYFNVSNIHSWLKKLGLFRHSIEVKYRGFPHPCFSIFQLPHEIIVKIKVGEY